MGEKKLIKTDVLVIGAGMAGWFAADKARAQGAAVVLVDKGYIGKAGQSSFATGFSVCSPEFGDDIETFIEKVHVAGEYVNNQYWTRTVLANGWDRARDLMDWGCEFEKDENGNILRKSRDNDVPCMRLAVSEQNAVPFKQTSSYKIRKHLEKIGVQLIDRVMMVELMKQNGRVCGGIGISVDSDDRYIIDAGAVIICSGASSFKPAGYTCLVTSTGDGELMGFRAGAALIGKEYICPMRTAKEVPNSIGRRGLTPEREKQLPHVDTTNNKGVVAIPNMRQYDGQPAHAHPGKIAGYPFTYLDLEIETHEGKGPFFGEIGEPKQTVEVVSGAALGMSIRKGDGLWPEDSECRSSVPGLFAAGDSLGTMQNGAIYRQAGGSLAGCAVTGAIAGEAAAKEVLALGERPGVADEEVERALGYVDMPVKATGGYSPEWAINYLRSIMSPYFVYSVKKADRLEAVLTLVMFMKEHIAPKLIARDDHELRLAHEAKSMIFGAEVRLRSALFRTESRGMHFREDYPNRDDENWLCWTKVVNNGGNVDFVKVPIPEEWKPDKNMTYEEKYPYAYPGERRA